MFFLFHTRYYNPQFSSIQITVFFHHNSCNSIPYYFQFNWYTSTQYGISLLFLISLFVLIMSGITWLKKSSWTNLSRFISSTSPQLSILYLWNISLLTSSLLSIERSRIIGCLGILLDALQLPSTCLVGEYFSSTCFKKIVDAITFLIYLINIRKTHFYNIFFWLHHTYIIINHSWTDCFDIFLCLLIITISIHQFTKFKKFRSNKDVLWYWWMTI